MQKKSHKKAFKETELLFTALRHKIAKSTRFIFHEASLEIDSSLLFIIRRFPSSRTPCVKRCLPPLVIQRKFCRRSSAPVMRTDRKTVS